MGEPVSEGWAEFWRSNISKLGVFFLLLVIGVSVYTVTTMPLDYGTKYWSNPIHWVDNPKAVPPEWVNAFANPRLLRHQTLSDDTPSTDFEQGKTVTQYDVQYSLDVDQFPTFLNLNIGKLVFSGDAPAVMVSVKRPDGYRVDLVTFVVEHPQSGEQAPYVRYEKEAKRMLLSGDTQVARGLSIYLLDRYDVLIPPSQVKDIGFEKIIFGARNAAGGYAPLKGVYTMSVRMASGNPADRISSVSFVLGGQVYGLMGTDSLGRDLAAGLLFGFPVALLIGFSTSVITTLLGASLGIVGGYTGGVWDELIQRVSDVVNNIPQLPLLIFLTFVFGGKLWVIVVVLVAFGWPGLTIIVRSMILSIKQAPFIEAAVAVGTSRWRIMARHIFPQVAPFILSQLIFNTPSAILSEAALSFLGLGDPTIPTWGQILEYGFRNSAVYLGYWWWILPPGLLVIFSAITFVFLAMGLEPVVNPRLRRWK